MRFLFLCDSYKGSLSSAEANLILSRSALEVFPDAECECIPIADGGEGTLEAFLSLCGGERIKQSVHDPLGRKIEASYAAINGKAIVVMAEASGLPRLAQGERNPLYTTSYGTGELILAALRAGYRDITVAIGGSATNDGGIGAISALGARFLDADGAPLDGIGANLERICKIDLTDFTPLAREARFTVMCDVDNPLCGELGATYVYGRQKGATDEMLARLERGMQSYAHVLHKNFSIDVQAIRGGGAAGGLGAALSLFLGAEMRSGIDVLLDMADFDQKLTAADFVFTGEGRIDRQSAYGKVISGIAKRTRRVGKPLFCIAGSIGDGAETLYGIGVTAMYAIVDHPMSLTDAIDNAEFLLSKAARNLFRTLRAARNE